MRKGFKSIVVDDIQYQYCVSLATNLLIVYRGKQRMTYLLRYPSSTITWRGKRKAGIFGKKEVAWIIKYGDMYP
jgi:hypothetical protein